ncbi:MAG TPA: HAMP domain-containing sensor histidine kinase [Candidatus Baltobacteraceae bacterium]|nr:HAMP domain-containing sensor histidine kinase [Candidatus Baltobacteraceae bacterium]
MTASAFAIRFTVVHLVRQGNASRLEDVARAGLRSIVFNDGTFAVDRRHIAMSGLLAETQGLRWFDADGRLVKSQGLVPNPMMAGEFHTYAMPIVDPATRKRVGTVAASFWTGDKRDEFAYLDLGLVVGAVLALAGSGLVGWAFSRWAAKLVEESVRKLREFTADASHELRSPIAAISANAGAALRDPQRDPVRDLRRFEAIADGAAQITRLTGDLLILAAVDRPLDRDVFAIDLRDALQKAAEEYRPQFEAAGLHFSVKTPAIPVYYGSPDQIDRIVANLLENAARYTPEGGTVCLEAEQSGPNIHIAVHDTGVGIRTEDLDRVFDRFWRADPSRVSNGTGLGLSIVRALARRHGGDVKAISTYGAGSTFVVVLPLRLPLREKSS